MHCGQGRKASLNVEYVHIGICLGFIQDIFTEALLSHPRLSMSRKIALVRAIGKVIWIQNDLFAKWYVRDGEEFAGLSRGQETVDEEGYLNGKKILSEDVESSPTTDTGEEPTIPAQCPFSGMVMEGKTGSRIPTPTGSSGQKKEGSEE